MLVVVVDVVLDFGHKLLDTSERSAPDSFLSDDIEPDLDLIQPGGIGRGVMDVPSFMRGKPSLDFRMFVRGIVVDHDMHIELLRNVLLYMLQERQILLMPVSPFALGEHLTVGNVESGKERRRAVSFIIVGDPLNISQTHRQHGLCSFQGLDLALFIDAEHDGILWGAQVEPHDITDFFHKERIGRELEVSLPVRLKPEGLPDAVDGRAGDSCFPCDRADCPVCPICGFGLQGPTDQRCDSLIRDRPRASRLQFVVESLDTVIEVAFAPQTDRLLAVAKFLSDQSARQTIGCHEHDACAHNKSVW